MQHLNLRIDIRGIFDKILKRAKTKLENILKVIMPKCHAISDKFVTFGAHSTFYLI